MAKFATAPNRGYKKNARAFHANGFHAGESVLRKKLALPPSIFIFGEERFGERERRRRGDGGRREIWGRRRDHTREREDTEIWGEGGRRERFGEREREDAERFGERERTQREIQRERGRERDETGKTLFFEIKSPNIKPKPPISSFSNPFAEAEQMKSLDALIARKKRKKEEEEPKKRKKEEEEIRLKEEEEE